ncbi:MAG: OmpA family protein [Holophagales bacterium]|jgi:peptidoglycan-associated lipoprotein|nr:OmpA family protein [Holophagales bacterium]
MSNIRLLTTLAVLLSLGIGTACKPPEAELRTQAAAEAAEQASKLAAEAEAEARRLAAEAEARRLAEEAEAKRLAAEAEARRLAEEARTAMLNAAATALVNINFDYNRSDIRRADRLKFQAIADFMKAYPEALLRVEGHCDERGTVEYNMTLGEKRAFAAKTYLISLGVNEARINTLSFGKERPLFADHSEKSWFANRRCEFKL